MPKIQYKDIRLGAKSLALVDTCNTIIDSYTAQGFTLTLRQLYYQLVSRDILPNKQTEYKRLGDIISDARLAGLIDWHAIEDRTRNVRSMAHWDTPGQIVSACAAQFHMDMWEGQDYQPEVWIEKDALIGVIEGVCREYDVPHFSCRGYTSQSEMWVGAQRIKRYLRLGQTPVILHLGDHDPSGKDMTRDIKERLDLFTSSDIEVRRLALNMDQVRQYNPPPNPAKLTDSRAESYIRVYGDDSWELDALEPAVIAGLIRDNLVEMIDPDKWQEREDAVSRGRAELKSVSDKWETAVDAVR
jgi:pentatricopeptide repeat protein